MHSDQNSPDSSGPYSRRTDRDLKTSPARWSSTGSSRSPARLPLSWGTKMSLGRSLVPDRQPNRFCSDRSAKHLSIGTFAENPKLQAYNRLPAKRIQLVAQEHESGRDISNHDCATGAACLRRAHGILG